MTYCENLIAFHFVKSSKIRIYWRQCQMKQLIFPTSEMQLIVFEAQCSNFI